MKTVETAFQHLADSRLVEDTFTCEGERGGREGEKRGVGGREGGREENGRERQEGGRERGKVCKDSGYFHREGKEIQVALVDSRLVEIYIPVPLHVYV